MNTDIKIETPEVIKVVENWVFVFTSGKDLSITLDEASGDTIEFDEMGGQIKVNIAPKVSPVDSKTIAQGKTIVIAASNLAYYERQENHQRQLTPDEEYQKKVLLDPILKAAQHYV